MRDYSTISPSAKSLLLMKALTDIPFIADAAHQMWGEATVTAFKSQRQDAPFLKRLLHFEVRYKSIDSLLETLGSKSILEISSGFSFRGLNMAINHPDVFYADTDLSEVITPKGDLTMQLMEELKLKLKGELVMKAMNALDEESFRKTINLLPAGTVTIVNECFLVYFNTTEKNKLFEII